MNLKKWTKKAAENAKSDQLFLKLLESKNGDVVLAVVKKDGERIDCGSLLKIINDRGAIVICNNINNDIPLKTDIFEAPLVVQETLLETWTVNNMKSIAVKKEGLDRLREFLEKMASK